MQLGAILVKRLEVPSNTEKPHRAIDGFNTNRGDFVACCQVGIIDLKRQKSHGHSRYNDSFARFFPFGRQHLDRTAMRHKLGVALHIENEIEKL